MTAPDSRDSVERVVAEIRSTGNAIGPERMAPLLKEWADRLQALARGPQQAGGEDGVRRFRQLTKSDGAGLLLHGGFVESATDGPWVLYEEYAELEKMYQQQGLNAHALLKRAETAEAALREAQTNDRRYRLLREEDRDLSELLKLVVGLKPGGRGTYIRALRHTHYLDAAIDAAIEQANR